MAKVFMYPGQGSQHPGMAGEAIKVVPSAAELFGEATAYASEKMGCDIAKLMLEGPKEDLSDTRITQPIIFIANIVGAKALSEIIECQPDVRVGHSFGHLAAQHDDGVFETQTGIDLAISRGEYMHQAAVDRPGAMAAVFKVAEERLLAICEKYGVHLANDNSDTELIISGDEKNMAAAAKEIEDSGGRVLKIPVKVGAHSPIVQSAADKMSLLADRLHVQQRRIRMPERLAVMSSRTVERLRSISDIKADIAGLTDKVEWRNTVGRLILDGYTEFYETGPGSKLTNLPRRAPKMKALLESHGATMTSLDQILEALKV